MSGLLPMIFLVPFAPFIIIASKISTILYHGPAVTQAAAYLAMIEGLVESTPQLALQLYIILARADRQPSMIQWLGIITSCVALTLPKIKAINRARNEKLEGLKEEVLSVLRYIPFCLTFIFFRIGTTAVLVVLMKWHSLTFYIVNVGFC